MDKPINTKRIKVLLKMGYATIDLDKQTIFKPDGTQTDIPQWEVSYYKELYRFQHMRGLV
jgi:hypothetical protein